MEPQPRVTKKEIMPKLVKKCLEDHRKVRKQKGCLVPGLPPLEYLIRDFNKDIHNPKTMTIDPTCKLLRTETIAPPLSLPHLHFPYPASVLPQEKLSPIFMRELKLETHHRGRKLLVKVCTIPKCGVSLNAIVKDLEDTGMLLTIYFQPLEVVALIHSQRLRPDRVYVIREPFLKGRADGSCCLRVDHTTDIEAVPPRYYPSKWTLDVPDPERGPARLGLRTFDSPCLSNPPHEEFIRAGNFAMLKNRFPEGHVLSVMNDPVRSVESVLEANKRFTRYTWATASAKSQEEHRQAYLQRVKASIKLGHPQRAQINLELAQRFDPELNNWSIADFCEANVLYALGDWDGAHALFKRILRNEPENSGHRRAQDEVNRCLDRISERDSGKYDWSKMLKQCKMTPPIVDCASYSNHVEVRASNKHRMGLFTTTSVQAGELLLCEKAFAYKWDDGDSPKVPENLVFDREYKKFSIVGQASFLSQLLQKQYCNPDICDKFRSLYSGRHSSPGHDSISNRRVVDTFVTANILARNAFRCPKSSRGSLEARDCASRSPWQMYYPNGEDKPGAARLGGQGIWILSSRINHSCIGNCRRAYIGDMVIVRASMDLPAGTELFAPYRIPEPLESLVETQLFLKSLWGFTCDCPLCEMKGKTTGAVLQARQAAYLAFEQAALANIFFDQSSEECWLKLENMLDTYAEGWDPTSPTGAPIRYEVRPALDAGIAILVKEGRVGEVATLAQEWLLSLDFWITLALPPGLRGWGGDESAEPVFGITQWGFLPDQMPSVFYNLSLCFEALGSAECAKKAMEYDRIATLIVVGDELPQTARGKLDDSHVAPLMIHSPSGFDLE